MNIYKGFCSISGFALISALGIKNSHRLSVLETVITLLSTIEE
jgi:hypothetical protein